MIDFNYFSLGVLLWLICCGLLITLFNDNSPSASRKQTAKSDSIINNSLFNYEQNIAEIEHLKKQLTIKIEELQITKEKNQVLEEELQITSDRLESNEDEYIKYQQNFNKEVHALENQIKKLEHKCLNLENKCLDLTEKLHSLPSELMSQWQGESFNLLQTLLANYPTAKTMIKVKSDFPAKNIIALLKPLDKLLAKWGIESIGKPWQKVEFNPEIYYSNEENLTPNELVYIRFIGYRQGNNILLHAKVSRTLPQKSV